jgi:hypothetical protein
MELAFLAAVVSTAYGAFFVRWSDPIRRGWRPPLR